VLNDLGAPLIETELSAYLTYLEESGYIRLKRFNNNILYAQILPKGLQLQARVFEDELVGVIPYQRF
jgi:hypothetical protein